MWNRLILLLIFSLQAGFAYADGATPNYFDFKQVKKIYYVLAASKGMERSSFGHAYLRLSHGSTPTSQDVIIEFVADSSEMDLVYLRAMGIGPSYARKVTLDRYPKVQQTMNFLLDRSLTSYELLLNETQKVKLTALIEKAVSDGRFGNYSFFSENCAAAVSELLTSSEVRITGLQALIPSRIPSLLQKRKIVGKVYRDLSLSERREFLLEKYRKGLTPLFQKFPFLEDDLRSQELAKRVFAYVFIHGNRSLLDAKNQSNARLFLIANSWLEPRIVRRDLEAFISNAEVFDLSAEQATTIEVRGQGEGGLPPEGLFLEEMKFIAKGHGVLAQLVLDPRGSDDRRPVIVELMLRDVEIRDSRVYWGRHSIGIFRKDSKEIVFVNASPIVHVGKINQAHWSVDFRLLVEREELRIAPVGDEDLIPLKNRYPGFPACYGFVELQKSIYERVVFDPESPSIDEAESLSLLEKLLGGDFVVVPGFAHANAWIMSMNETEVMKRIYQHHREQYSRVSSAVKLYFKQHKVGTENLIAIAKLAHEGIFSPLHFRVGNSNSGHAILLLGAKETSGEIRIRAYDPNFGIVDDFFIYNKSNQRLNTPVYGKNVVLYMVSEDIYAAANSLRFTQGSSRKLLLDFARKTGRRAFSIWEIAKAL